MDTFDHLDNLHSLAAFHTLLQSYLTLIQCRGFFDVCDDDICTDTPLPKGPSSIDSEPQSQQQTLPSTAADQEAGTNGGQDSGQGPSLSHTVAGHKKSYSGLLQQDNVFSPKKFVNDGDRYISFSGQYSM